MAAGIAFRIVLFFSLTSPLLAHADEQWFSVLLDGAKVGQSVMTHSTSADRMTDSTHTVIELKGAGRANRLDIELRFESDQDSKPLTYSNHVRTRDIDRQQRGSVEGETINLRSIYAGIEQRDHITLVHDVLWPAQEMQLLHHTELKQGNTVEFQAFDAMQGLTIPVELRIGAHAIVDSIDHMRPVTEIARTARYPNHVAVTTTYVDADYQPLRITTEISGLQMQLVAVTRQQAEAPNQPLDYLNRMLVRSPFRISHDALSKHLRYVLALRDGTAPNLPQTAEQRARSDATTTTIDVCNNCGEEPTEEKPAPETLRPNAWMQSDAAEIRTIAKNVGNDVDPRQRMRALTDYVRLHMHGSSEFLGYISALEASRTGNGDCTAYALLLATLGRAANVPTRVAVGMVYAERFNNRSDVFMPHAWAQAWIGGRWESFDAATEGFDSTHIALAIGQGDPSRYSTAMGTLARMEMRSATQIAMKSAARK